MDINSLSQTIHFFFIISAELVVLFIGISFLVGLLQEYIPAATVQRVLSGRRGQGNILGRPWGPLLPSAPVLPYLLWWD
ncbi:MAG: uncharacterized protein PWP65_1975 [Clostridia bacterium]|jgi:hypothetical protein|nr:uncharacterized protein [Clostridia bacterium]